MPRGNLPILLLYSDRDSLEYYHDAHCFDRFHHCGLIRLPSTLRRGRGVEHFYGTRRTKRRYSFVRLFVLRASLARDCF